MTSVNRLREKGNQTEMLESYPSDMIVGGGTYLGLEHVKQKSFFLDTYS